MHLCVWSCIDEIIAEQQARASTLKQRTERTHCMSEPDLSQLRADIKVPLTALSAAPGSPGNLPEFEIAPGSTGNFLDEFR